MTTAEHDGLSDDGLPGEVAEYVATVASILRGNHDFAPPHAGLPGDLASYVQSVEAMIVSNSVDRGDTQVVESKAQKPPTLASLDYAHSPLGVGIVGLLLVGTLIFDDYISKHAMTYGEVLRHFNPTQLVYLLQSMITRSLYR